MSLLVLYHANCWDGFCAAWICHKVYPDAEYVPVHYGKDAPDVTNREVLILDFSYPREQLLAMRGVAISIFVLDHHKTAQEALTGLDFCVFDMNKSGARLTWEYIWNQHWAKYAYIDADNGSRYDKDHAPWLVDYTEDRDLWAWKLPDSHAISAALRTYPLDFDEWDKLERDPSSIQRLATEGAAIRKCEKAIIDAHVRNATEIEMDGHKILSCNATTLMSEIGQELCKDRPFSATWFETGEGERVYSLRSNEQGIDVSEIAKAHGGGGHKNAAGFKEKVKS